MQYCDKNQIGLLMCISMSMILWMSPNSDRAEKWRETFGCVEFRPIYGFWMCGPAKKQTKKFSILKNRRQNKKKGLPNLHASLPI